MLSGIGGAARLYQALVPSSKASHEVGVLPREPNIAYLKNTSQTIQGALMRVGGVHSLIKPYWALWLDHFFKKANIARKSRRVRPGVSGDGGIAVAS